MYKISEGVYTLQGLRVGRVYLIEGADGLTLIDASVEGAEGAIERELAQRSYTLKAIRRILITHAHPDHIGALAALVQASGATVYAHALEAPIIRGEQPPKYAPDYKDSLFNRSFSALLGIRGMPPSRVDRLIAEGDLLPEVLPDLQVIEAPGHAYGQVAFYSPERKLLFCGDAWCVSQDGSVCRLPLSRPISLRRSAASKNSPNLTLRGCVSVTACR